MSPAILVDNVTKSFGHVRALDGLNLTVEPGEIHGFLGPNGAGKTTTLRILLGLVGADSGKAELLGGNPWKDAVELHKRIAYVPGDVALWPSLSGGETIDLLGRLRGNINPNRRAELIERFDLDPSKKGRSYSKGNRQKVALIAALASDTELLLLDEPTAGLDPLMEAAFRECITKEAADGRTVLLSSHILSEVEAVCGRVTIIREGRTVESGSIEEMRHLKHMIVTAELNGPVPQAIKTVNGVENVRVEGNSLECQVEPASLDEVLRLLTQVGVASLTSEPPTLEELFLRYYASREDSETRGADSAK
ncbi:MAG: ABC transporter ATP-binding protein [Acidobacteria bacterium]|nr:MAG: ABC transporter ATP-binding protein [Acidobacteriota bacterium]